MIIPTVRMAPAKHAHGVWETVESAEPARILSFEPRTASPAETTAWPWRWSRVEPEPAAPQA